MSSNPGGVVEDSDYGSDLGEDGEAQLCGLLDEIEVRRTAAPLVLESIEEDDSRRRFAFVPTSSAQGRDSLRRGEQVARVPIEVEYDGDAAASCRCTPPWT